MNDICQFRRDHVVECSERTVLSYLELVCYVGDVSGDTSPIIWQRVMVGQQIYVPVSELRGNTACL